MKKILLSLFVSGASLCAFAQPTWDFEGWNGTGPNEQPNGWISGNVLVNILLPGNVQSVFKATAPDIHGGTYAMKIQTVDVATNPNAAQIPDPIGFSATGVVSGTSLKTGFAYTSRPATVDFWYKYAPTGSDTTSFFMYLSKWNTSTLMKDTVAWGYWESSAAQATYALTTVTLTYVSTTLFPDTAGVLFSATGTGCMTCGNIGSAMWVDDVTFSGWNGINEHPSTNDMTLYPNPANDYLTIIADVTEASSVIAYDATGRIVSSSAMVSSNSGSNRKSVVMNTSTFSAGLYSYSVLDKNGSSLRTGKFSVVK